MPRLVDVILLLNVLPLCAKADENVGSLEDLYATRKDTLSLIMMGDPQYHFMCEEDNVQCKHISRKCRQQYGVISYISEMPPGTNETMRKGKDLCIKIESRFANRVQRQSVVSLVQKMRYKPHSLVINGDLTDFGHLHQLEELKKGWINDFPIKILVGLGNHDYQNNIDDCTFNFCAHTMLSWYYTYAHNKSIAVDMQRDLLNAFEVNFSGSLGYIERVCSITGTNCAHLIQLNNAVDYAVSFKSFLVQWDIDSPLEFLKKKLAVVEDDNMPVLLNMHQCENIQLQKVKNVVADWIYHNQLKKRTKRVAVFFAHMHQRHEAHVHCIHGVEVPFVYIGSVPNNRFSLLRLSKNGTATVTGLKANDYLMHDGEVLEHLGDLDDIWGSNCTSRSIRYLDKATRRRWGLEQGN